jgi:hypothetical protein
MDLLIILLVVLLVLAQIGGFAVDSLLWILAVILLVVLIWRLMAGRRAV